MNRKTILTSVSPKISFVAGCFLDNLYLPMARAGLAWLILLALPVVVNAQFTFVTNNGSITITKYTGPDGAVTIPDTINGLPVTRIGDNAFYYDKGSSIHPVVTSVTIPNSVTNIGNSTFRYSGALTSVSLGTNVADIGSWAFGECTNLTSIALEANVAAIGLCAFGDCAHLTAIIVNASNANYRSVNGVLFDGNQTALIQCPGAKAGDYAIPDGVAAIGNSAFYGCALLANVTIPDSVTGIGPSAFYQCTSLAEVVMGNSVTNIGNSAFYSCSSLAGITIPDSVTSIGAMAFGRCSGLASVAMGHGVTSIGSDAFYSCTSLAGVTIPDSVTNIGVRAFDQCAGLTNVAIGNGVTSIGYEAFYGCSSLISITIPDNVTSMGYMAFTACSGLTSVTIGNGLTSIEYDEFTWCGNLTNVTIGNSVTSIGESAFGWCSSLVSLTIPRSVTSLNGWAFEYCTGLKSVFFEGDAPLPYSDVFLGDSGTTVYYLPNTLGWSSPFAGRPAVLWNPEAQTGGSNFGVGTNGFGFNVTGTANIPILLNACTNLTGPTWTTLQSCNLTNGSVYFSDPDWTNYPARFYRIRSP